LSQIALWERGTFQSVAWLPDGKTLAVSSSIGVYFFDAATLNQVRFIRTGMQPQVFTVSPDGQLFALLSQVQCEEQVQFWNESGFLIPPQRFRVCSAPWQIWDVKTGELLYTLDSPPDVMSIAFSPDGRVLATSGIYECSQSGLCKHDIRLWDARTGWPLRTIESKQGSIAFSPDGSTLALGGVGLQLWDVTTGQLQRTFQVDEGLFFPSSFAFNPNGRTLALGGDNSTVGCCKRAVIAKGREPVRKHGF
jgi:WD40 repeat protein